MILGNQSVKIIRLQYIPVFRVGTLILTIHFGREKDIWIKGPQLTNRDYLNDTTNAGY